MEPVIGDGLRIRLLGPVEAERGGATVPLGGAKQRIVLAVLALEVGRVVSADRLIDCVWGEAPSDKAAATLQVYVSNLRRLLGPGAAGGPAIVGRRPGYLLDLAPDAVDAPAFERLVDEGRLHRRAGALEEASRTLAAALALWRGRPLAELAAEPFAAGETARLEEQRVAVLEERAEVELELGRHRELVPALEATVGEYPLREGLHAALMTALYRCGRQADALRVFQRLRSTLDDELGLDPGPDLRRLEQAILRQDPGLEYAARPDSGAVTLTVDATDTAPTAWLVFPRGARVPLGRGRLVLGRSEDCDVVVPDARTSRRHAAVTGTEDGFELVDLESRNGTVVAGNVLAPMTPVSLADGDEIVVGTTRLRFTTRRAAV